MNKKDWARKVGWNQDRGSYRDKAYWGARRQDEEILRLLSVNTHLTARGISADMRTRGIGMSSGAVESRLQEMEFMGFVEQTGGYTKNVDPDLIAPMWRIL